MLQKRVLFEKNQVFAPPFSGRISIFFFPEKVEDFPLFLFDPYLVCICIHSVLSMRSFSLRPPAPPLVPHVSHFGANVPFFIEGILLAFGKKNTEKEDKPVESGQEKQEMKFNSFFIQIRFQSALDFKKLSIFSNGLQFLFEKPE